MPMAYAPRLSLGAPKHCAPQNVMGMWLKGAPDRSSMSPSASRMHVDPAGSASVSSPQVVGMSLTLPSLTLPSLTAAAASRAEGPASRAPMPGDAPLPEPHADDANARTRTARFTMPTQSWTAPHLLSRPIGDAPRAPVYVCDSTRIHVR